MGELVIGGAPMADIGTDHAGLPAWLVASGRVPSAIAVDVAEGPIAAARTGAAGIAAIEVRHGDGLGPLRDGEVATVVIAGMGGARMRSLVDAGVPTGVQRLVLQPNTEWAATRAWIAARRFTLEDERMVEDRGKFYVVLAVSPLVGEAPVWDAADLELGPLLRRRGDPVWQAWVAATCETLRRAIGAATMSETPADPRRDALNERHGLFQRALRACARG